MRKSIALKSIIVLFLILTVSISCTKSEKKNGEDALEKTESRLFIEVDSLQFLNPKKGDLIYFEIDGGLSYQLQITLVETSMPGILGISANIGNGEEGHASFILRNGKMAGSLVLYKKGKNYDLNYDESAEKHYIKMVNQKEKNILPGGEPLETF